MKFGLILIMSAFASENEENKVESAMSEEKFAEKNDENLILVKIEDDEYTKAKKKTSIYIGVYYDESKAKWGVQRWSKKEKKKVYNGCYKGEETAAHASDTLARKLMTNDKQKLKLNFRDDHTEVYPEKKITSSNYIGVFYDESKAKWSVQRRSKKEKKRVYNGCYKDEETAAHASDTLARKLMAKNKQKLKLNFSDDQTEVYPEKNETYSKHIGVSYNESVAKWSAQRWNKKEKNLIYNGAYKDEETAAHASDNLARKLMANGEQNHKLNFPDDYTEVYPEEKMTSSNYIGVFYDESKARWRAQRRSKNENKQVYNGTHKDEETAAHASDTLARKLMENGEQNHKLNFPDDDTEVYPEDLKRSSKYIGVSYNKQNKRWSAQRRNKNEKKNVFNGYHKDEETAAHASDTLARKLMENGKQNHKFNFPDEDGEMNLKEHQKRKRKRSDNEGLGHFYNK